MIPKATILRRNYLIDKDIAGTITLSEVAELVRLEDEIRRVIDGSLPYKVVPIDQLRKEAMKSAPGRSALAG